MNKEELHQTINRLCVPGKGILAADESTGTIGKRLKTINVENNLENRINYRRLLFTTPNLNKHISGVITYEETLLNKELIQPLLDSNIVIGIKLDKGIKPLYYNNEYVSQGLDNLSDRCEKYYNAGARFAKWRSVLKIQNNDISEFAIQQNAMVLARYASICQNHGLVPIVEPEIIMDGDHSIETTYKVTVKVLSVLYRELVRHNVILDCSLLKPNMVRSGDDNSSIISLDDIASLTVNALQQTVPVSVPGIFFLSGGMSEMDSTLVLDKINKLKTKKPWFLSFSYGRALQESVLKTWKGDYANIKLSQDRLQQRTTENGIVTLQKL
tara:strand:+ start:675 stop:1655 length:981 start_codon:yes stop_codon:yes gene_type:complete